MPNLPSAKKSIRKDMKRHIRNVAIRSNLKTIIKKLDALISANKADEAAKQLSVIMSKLDKAAKKDIIKGGKADRLKSRLSCRLAKMKKTA